MCFSERNKVVRITKGIEEPKWTELMGQGWGYERTRIPECNLYIMRSWSFCHWRAAATNAIDVAIAASRARLTCVWINIRKKAVHNQRRRDAQRVSQGRSMHASERRRR